MGKKKTVILESDEIKLMLRRILNCLEGDAMRQMDVDTGVSYNETMGEFTLGWLYLLYKKIGGGRISPSCKRDLNRFRLAFKMENEDYVGRFHKRFETLKKKMKKKMKK